MQAVTRPNFAVKINFGKVLMAFAFVAVMSVFITSPVYAQSNNAFSDFQSKVTSKTTEAYNVGIAILQVAAVLALVIGIAPMLWGQFKAKWVISCLCACALFGMASMIVRAFTS